MSEAFASKNYYERLNVPRDATKKQITKAFREIASVYHPDAGLYSEVGGDLSGGHLDIFVLITEAYNTLNDDEKRAAYDAKLGPETQGKTEQKRPRKKTTGWSDISRFDEEDQRKAEEMRAKFKERESAFEDGGEIRSSLNIGGMAQRTSVLRSAVYDGKAVDVDSEDLSDFADPDENPNRVDPLKFLHELHEIDAESIGESMSERFRDLFDMRRPIIPIVVGLLVGVAVCVAVALLFFA